MILVRNSEVTLVIFVYFISKYLSFKQIFWYKITVYISQKNKIIINK